MRIPTIAGTIALAALFGQPAFAQQEERPLKPLSKLSPGERTPSDRALRAEDRTWWTVSAGQSFWAVAAQRAGVGASDAEVQAEMERIWNLNSRRVRSGQPDLIYPGERLRLT